jgi:hypothetical protein
VREISLSEFGLETVTVACARKKWSPKSVQNWVRAGLIPAVPVGGGRGTYLLRVADVDAFAPPARGPKTGNQNAKKKGKVKK